MSTKSTITEQLRRNTVALISLAIAITSLGYNTWRNEASEHNRNQRLVAIELLLMLGDLQQITMDCHYGMSDDKDALLREGWAKVLTIRDIAQVASGGVPAMAGTLHQVWDDDREALGESVQAKNRIIMALENVRASTHEVLRSLD